jgi:hypothetical protein
VRERSHRRSYGCALKAWVRAHVHVGIGCSADGTDAPRPEKRQVPPARQRTDGDLRRLVSCPRAAGNHFGRSSEKPASACPPPHRPSPLPDRRGPLDPSALPSLRPQRSPSSVSAALFRAAAEGGPRLERSMGRRDVGRLRRGEAEEEVAFEEESFFTGERSAGRNSSSAQDSARTEISGLTGEARRARRQ